VEKFARGVFFFALGLGKKVLIANPVGALADAAFRAESLPWIDAWYGIFSYAFQIYFDFSGYSDMAIGLARLFGIRLPMNFNSPYQARNIADFWRRWHITLSRFLRDYVYIPLGGNRHGVARKYLNLFLTMLIGGIWHGAGWTFVIWGALHGFYLLVHHAWRDWRGARSPAAPTRLSLFSARAATFLAVVFAWIFFRAASFAAVLNLLQGMVGRHGVQSNLSRISLTNGWIYTGLLLLIVWFLPNTNQLLARFLPTLDYEEENEKTATPAPHEKLAWTPGPAWALVVVVLAACSVVGLSRVSEFIYWQF
jgi:D-alanyl-lipoteichoic acid acyltransferase DltB (MBOAT superfamily)